MRKRTGQEEKNKNSIYPTVSPKTNCLRREALQAYHRVGKKSQLFAKSQQIAELFLQQPKSSAQVAMIWFSISLIK